MSLRNRAFTYDVTAAILVFQNKETATNPPGIALMHVYVRLVNLTHKPKCKP